MSFSCGGAVVVGCLCGGIHRTDNSLPNKTLRTSAVVAVANPEVLPPIEERTKCHSHLIGDGPPRKTGGIRERFFPFATATTANSLSHTHNYNTINHLNTAPSCGGKPSQPPHDHRNHRKIAGAAITTDRLQLRTISADVTALPPVGNHERRSVLNRRTETHEDRCHN